MGDEITRKIIRDLAKKRPRDAIITELCEFACLKWDQAERLVNEIELENTEDILSRQKLFNILLGSAFALGGFLLSACIVFASFNGMILFFLGLPIPYLGNILYFVIGILAFMGGLRGIVSTQES